MIHRIGAILGLCLAFGTACGAETVLPGIWSNRAFIWYYNPHDSPAWMTVDEAQALVQGAALKWASCGITMTYAGETDRMPGEMDGVNVMGWSTSIPANLRGLTVGQAHASILLERDVLIRADRREFRLFPRLLEKVVVHEFGHAIGLTHSSRCNDVMTLAADCPKVDPAILPVVPTENDLARCSRLYGVRLYQDANK